MLPISSKLLTVQIITTTTFITIMLLGSLCSITESLPITSKPIESTAENLAWEAWLMVPVNQHQKSRKVTPKSIFIVPQKKNQSTTTMQCPPGEHLFESRCIPTVNIDTDKILLTQLTNLVITSGDYDYDYEDGNDSPGAEKLAGGDIEVIPSANVDTPDEPLKFDIFRDNFPIGSSGSGDSSGSKDSDDENIFFVGERRRRPPLPQDGGELPDLDTDSASYGLQNEDDDEPKDTDEQSTLFLSGIDAILVPAGAVTPGNDRNLNFSVYQDVINTTVGNSNVEVLTPIADKDGDLGNILEKESLFLDRDYDAGVTTTDRIQTTTDQFESESTTQKMDEGDGEIESKTEFPRSVTQTNPDGDITNSSTDFSLSTAVEDISTTMLTTDDTTIHTEQDTTIFSPNDGSTTIADSKDEITTIPDADPTKIIDSQPNRFIYHRPRDHLKPVIDVAAELKAINDLVARKYPSPKPTSAISSAEPTPSASNLWTKIIPSSNSIAETSAVSELSSSTIVDNISTSSNIFSSSSSSSSSSMDTSNTQGSIIDPTLSLISSTSPSTPTTVAQSDNFWWLPTGWRVNRTDTDRPLLLRFWSALQGISGSQTKV